MKQILFVLAFVSLSLFAQEPTTVENVTEQNIVKENGTEVYVDSTDKNVTDAVDDVEKHGSWEKTEDYNLSAESDFNLNAALYEYSELTDCEEDAQEIMADEAMAAVDLCPTRNIDIHLAHPIEIKKIKVTSRKLTNDECKLEATYTLSTLPPEEMRDIDAVCQDEYDGYGASLMLKDGLWQGLQLSFGVGYSGGDVGTMKGDLLTSITPDGSDELEYRYISAPMMTTDAAYLYKLPVANLYTLAGAELGWVAQQTNTTGGEPNADGEFEDGGSPYIFRVGVYGGLGYRYNMKYDIQSHVGYQFQYLYRTLKGADPIQGYANNIVYSVRGAYHFHENFAGYVKFQSNLNSVNSSVGITYEFWD